MPVLILWDTANQTFAAQDAAEQVVHSMSAHVSGSSKDMSATWIPVADMYETDTAVVITLELVNIDRHSLEIFYEDGYLLVQGARPFRADMQYARIHRIEWMYGNFRRVFWIPEQIDAEQIRASYAHGVLRIVLVKLQEKPEMSRTRGHPKENRAR